MNVCTSSWALLTGQLWLQGWPFWPSALTLCAALVLLCLIPQGPVYRLVQRRRRLRERAFVEDVLRQILQMEQDGKSVTDESLAGTLGRPVPVVRRILGRMAELDLVALQAPTVGLTASGKRWAMHILRAHRLWESYLADEARLPMTRIHTQAERQEHHLSELDLDAIDAHLGHPTQDPHGDPIPTADGELATPRGTPLPLWEGSPRARVVHVEDEPSDVFKRLLAKGIRPGVSLCIDQVRPGSVEALVDGQPVVLEQDLLPNVEVAEDEGHSTNTLALTRLSDLPTGTTAEIVALSEAIRGFSRRRLLDFGVTRGTRIFPVLDNPFGDPRAFRLRGTTIGIRDEQAHEIWVRPTSVTLSPQGGEPK